MLRTVIFLIFTHVDECTLLIVFPVLHSGSLVVVDSQYTCVYVNAKLLNYPCIHISSLWIIICCCESVSVLEMDLFHEILHSAYG